MLFDVPLLDPHKFMDVVGGWHGVEIWLNELTR